MNERPQVVLFAWADKKDWSPILTELNGEGFFCIFQGVDRRSEAKIGGASADYAIVDLEESSLETAKFILEHTPSLRGRIFLLGGISDTDGIVSSSAENIVKEIVQLRRK